MKNESTIDTRKSAFITDLCLYAFFTLLLLAVLYIFIGNTVEIYSVAFPMRNIIRFYISAIGILALIIYCLYTLIFGRKKGKIKKIHFKFLLMAACTLPVTAIYYINLKSQIVRFHMADSVMWIAVFFLCYFIGLKSSHQLYGRFFWAAIAVAFFFVYLGVFRLRQQIGVFPLVTTAYYAMLLLPFALAIKNKYVKWITVLFIAGDVLLSMKRAGFIALCGALAVYLVCDFLFNKDGKKKSTKFLTVIGIGAAICVLGYVFIKINHITVLDRILHIFEDGGSGRTKVWAQTWEMIRESSLTEKLFGHGFNTVYRDSPLKLSGHNDILECIYDYGYLGLLVYVSIILQIVSYLGKIRKNEPELVGSYMASFVLFGCMSMVSHLLLYPTYFIFLCMFWGLIIGQYDRKYSTEPAYQYHRTGL